MCVCLQELQSLHKRLEEQESGANEAMDAMRARLTEERNRRGNVEDELDTSRESFEEQLRNLNDELGALHKQVAHLTTCIDAREAELVTERTASGAAATEAHTTITRLKGKLRALKASRDAAVLEVERLTPAPSNGVAVHHSNGECAGESTVGAHESASIKQDSPAHLEALILANKTALATADSRIALLCADVERLTLELETSTEHCSENAAMKVLANAAEATVRSELESVRAENEASARALELRCSEAELLASHLEERCSALEAAQSQRADLWSDRVESIRACFELCERVQHESACVAEEVAECAAAAMTMRCGSRPQVDTSSDRPRHAAASSDGVDDRTQLVLLETKDCVSAPTMLHVLRLEELAQRYEACMLHSAESCSIRHDALERLALELVECKREASALHTARASHTVVQSGTAKATVCHDIRVSPENASDQCSSSDAGVLDVGVGRTVVEVADSEAPRDLNDAARGGGDDSLRHSLEARIQELQTELSQLTQKLQVHVRNLCLLAIEFHLHRITIVL